MCQSNLMGKESFMKIVLGIKVNRHHLTQFINSVENIDVNINAKTLIPLGRKQKKISLQPWPYKVLLFFLNTKHRKY